VFSAHRINLILESKKSGKTDFFPTIMDITFLYGNNNRLIASTSERISIATAVWIFCLSLNIDPKNICHVIVGHTHINNTETLKSPLINVSGPKPVISITYGQAGMKGPLCYYLTNLSKRFNRENGPLTDVLDSIYGNSEPVEHDVIISLSLEQYNKIVSETSMDKGECPVCRQEFNCESCVETPCCHQFHNNCLKQWLTENSPDCPACGQDQRTYLIGDSKDFQKWVCSL
jgi:hypothetical protein